MNLCHFRVELCLDKRLNIIRRRRRRGNGLIARRFELRLYSRKLGVGFRAFDIVLSLYSHALCICLRLCKLGFHLRLQHRAVVGRGMNNRLTGSLRVTLCKLGVEPCDFRFGFRALLVVLGVFRGKFGFVAFFENCPALLFLTFEHFFFSGVGLGIAVVGCGDFAARLGALSHFRLLAGALDLVFGVSPRAVGVLLGAGFRRLGALRLLLCEFGFHLRPYERGAVAALHDGLLLVVRTRDLRVCTQTLVFDCKARTLVFSLRTGFRAGTRGFRTN